MKHLSILTKDQAMTALTIVELETNQEYDRCQHCNLFVEIDACIGYCDNSACDHYSHVITKTHKACDAFMDNDAPLIRFSEEYEIPF